MPDNDKNDRRRSGPDGPSGPGIPRTRLTPWILIALVVLALVAFNQWFSTASRQSIDLSRFYQLVDEGKITPGTKVTISATQVTGTYTADDGTQCGECNGPQDRRHSVLCQQWTKQPPPWPPCPAPPPGPPSAGC